MITGVIKTLLKHEKINTCIIIVPTISLVSQFYKDMIEYGMDEEGIGRCGDGLKEFDKDIVISTWQTLIKYKAKIKRFECVIVDETHKGKCKSISDLLQTSMASWRFGFTGTLPNTDLELMQVQSYIGPKVLDIPAHALMKDGYISNLTILMYYLSYKDKIKRKTSYNDAKVGIFHNSFRLNIIKNILTNIKTNSLVLVNKVEDEGEFITNYLIENRVYNKENIIFISGKMKGKDREYWREKINNSKERHCIVATYQTFATGINLPNLTHLILASSFKSNITSGQSIGRLLRLHASKSENGAIVYDLVDMCYKSFIKQGSVRLKYYEDEKFEVIEKELKEAI
jgi:superfamily II DNA or RNA helicase